MRKKYITFGIEADNIQNAKQRLERIETDIINNFKILGVRAFSLNGMNDWSFCTRALTAARIIKFLLEFDLQNGTYHKGLYCPDLVQFLGRTVFQNGRHDRRRFVFAYISRPELTDEMLKNFLEIQSALSVNIHIKSIDQSKP